LENLPKDMLFNHCFRGLGSAMSFRGFIGKTKPDMPAGMQIPVTWVAKDSGLRSVNLKLRGPRTVTHVTFHRNLRKWECVGKYFNCHLLNHKWLNPRY
jgi:hypothetical protein